MKKIWQHITIFGLVAAILFSTTGFSQYQYVCSMLGEAEISFEKPKTCCSDDNCCDISLDFKKQDIVDVLKFQKIGFQAVLFLEQIQKIEFFVPFLFSNPKNSAFIFANSSPPLSGRQICILKNSFLI